MRHAGLDMGEELQRQEALGERLGAEMEQTEGRLQGLVGEVGDLLETQDAGQVCSCLMMGCLAICLLLLIILT